jgi:hypothetical protein
VYIRTYIQLGWGEKKTKNKTTQQPKQYIQHNNKKDPSLWDILAHRWGHMLYKARSWKNSSYHQMTILLSDDDHIS